MPFGCNLSLAAFYIRSYTHEIIPYLISPIERLAGGLSDGILVTITKVVKKKSSKKKRPHKSWLMSPAAQK